MNHTDFEYLRALVRRHSAIALEEGKEYLVETRLQSLARREGIDSVPELLRRIRLDQGHALIRKVVEAMTTNETSFFRDPSSYEAIRRTLIPELLRRRSAQRTLQIWSAACSSGQEPYSVAMLLREHFQELDNWHLRIIASDISLEMLDRARAGKYSQLEVNRGVPLPFLVRYFRRHGLDWTIDESVRRMVEFQSINLIMTWPQNGKIDLLLLRNVMIYFDADAKRQVLDRVADTLAPDGYLILGGSETTFFTNDLFERVETDGCGVYQLKRRHSR